MGHSISVFLRRGGVIPEIRLLVLTAHQNVDVRASLLCIRFSSSSWAVPAPQSSQSMAPSALPRWLRARAAEIQGPVVFPSRAQALDWAVGARAHVRGAGAQRRMRTTAVRACSRRSAGWGTREGARRHLVCAHHRPHPRHPRHPRDPAGRLHHRCHGVRSAPQRRPVLRLRLRGAAPRFVPGARGREAVGVGGTRRESV